MQLDPWQVDYGTELPLDEIEEQGHDETIALDVEIAPEDWGSRSHTLAPAAAAA